MLPHFQRVFRNAKTMVTFFAVSLAITLQSPSQEPNPIPPIERSLPPLGSKLTDSDAERLRSQLTQLQARFTPLSKHSLAPDAQIYLDSVRLALDHNEFYRNDDVARATEQLRTASARLDAIQSSSPQWTHAKGLVVRGYASAIDGSVQPYGLVIPENLDLSRPVPLYVWLHGRGDQTTNLAFIDERQSHVGTIAPDHAIVLHPFGRHCLGFKFAGEIDVLDAIEHVASQYSIDRQRIVLMGFSMGGAGTWHTAAHYPDHWVAMSPGAGFAETARYQNLDPESVPPYQRILWGAYDVPDYVRNLFNLPVIAYSGEKDRQIQAARVMQEAFAIEQHRLDHRIGPGMGHKYHPDILAEILRDLKAYCDRGRESNPRQVVLQTRTLRYHQVHWVDVQQLDTHWQDTRVDAERLDDGKLKIITRNVSALRVTPSDLQSDVEISIDGQTVQTKTEKASPSDRRWVDLVKRNGRWQAGTPDRNSLFKRPRLQGPIDDAFMEPFLVVLPSQQSNHPAVQRWIDFELAHFLARWQAVFRGTPRIKRDDELTADDIQQFHLILWGDPLSNHVIGRIAARLPITWNFDVINVAGKAYPSSSHVPVLIYPNPESVNRYVVLNSGPTFREAHDRTNSLQNPKLPDWAVIDLSQPPDASSPGRIAAADFFDEHWKIDDRE